MSRRINTPRGSGGSGGSGGSKSIKTPRTKRLDPSQPFSPRLRATLGLDDPDTLPEEELEHLDHLAAEQEFARWQAHQERSGRDPAVAKMRSKMVGLEDAFPDPALDSASEIDGGDSPGGTPTTITAVIQAPRHDGGQSPVNESKVFNGSNGFSGLRPESPFPTPQEVNLKDPKIETEQELTTEQANYIRAYIRAGGITDTALVSTGITRVVLKMWQQQPAFQAALAEAQEKWFEELRKAALLRAQAKSDVLLIFMLKALCPEVYDDNVRKARWMAQNGLVDSENLPVRATLVRDSRTLALHETQSIQSIQSTHSTHSTQVNVENVNVLINAQASRPVDAQRELDSSPEWREAISMDQSPLAPEHFDPDDPGEPRKR